LKPEIANEPELRSGSSGSLFFVLSYNFNLMETPLTASVSPLSALHEVSGEIAASLDPEQVYATAHRVVARLMPADVFIIALMEAAAQAVDFVYFFDKSGRIYPERQPAAGTLTARVVTANEVVRVGDEWAQHLPAVHLGDPDRVRSVLAVPLRLSGRAFGMISAQTYRPAVYTLEHEQTLSALANQIAIAVDHARLVASLRDSEERYRRIVEIAQEGICMFDAAGHIMFVNQRMAHILGYAAPELIGQTILNYMDEEGRAAAQRYLGRHGLGRELQRDFKLQHRSGQVVWAIISTKTLTNTRGDYIGVLGTVTDITERKHQEAELQRHAQQLHALIAASRDGVLLLGQDRRIKVINQNALDFLNIPGAPAQWLERPATQLLRLLRGRSNAAALQIVRVEARRVAWGDEPPAEGELDLPPRQLHWLNLPVLAEGAIFGRLLVLRDITQARALDQMRSDLTHMMVHDLRNPLSGVLSALDFLSEEAPDPDETQRLLELAMRNATRMLALIDTILEVSRLESGHIALHCATVQFEALTEQLLLLQQALAQQKQLRLINTLPKRLPPVWADEALLMRVLQNLVGNALKFTPAGGQITLSAQVVSSPVSALQIEVRDTGPGLAADLKPRLFQKFSTGNLIGRGSGLGLAFCRLAIEAHGGRIWAESEHGQGTVMRFTLPLHSARLLPAAA
jgi:PAS domain S-box-containing protein